MCGADVKAPGRVKVAAEAAFPFYVIRLCGGALYLAGMLLMSWNVVMTALAGRKPADETAPPALVGAAVA